MDPVAWERFVQLYGPLVYHWCRRIGLQDADAADVGQEVFRAVASGIESFRQDGAAGTFRRWLRIVTQSKVGDFNRRKSVADAVGGTTAQLVMQQVEVAPGSEETDPPESPDEIAILYRRAVDLILSGYQEPTRVAFLRVVVDRHDPADVARDLGLTVNAVYLAKSRIRKRLREEFSGLIEP